MVLATHWWAPTVPHTTLLLAAATVLLALVSAVAAKQSGRAAKAASRAADASTTAAQAAIDDAKATAESVEVARQSLARGQRPVLTDVPIAKLEAYGLAGDALSVVPASATSVKVCVPLRNVGAGPALIEVSDPAPSVQVRPDRTWYGSIANRLVLPVGSAMEVAVETGLVPNEGQHGAATVYLRVAYSNLAGNRFTTYLCLMRDFEVTQITTQMRGRCTASLCTTGIKRFVQAMDGTDSSRKARSDLPLRGVTGLALRAEISGWSSGCRNDSV